MSAPAVSVVVPTRDRAAMLRRCVTALARLQPPDGGFEVVIACDGPDPATETVQRELGERVEIVLATGPGGGPASARNAGAAAARGALLAFTDDDCEPTPGWLRALAIAAERAPGTAIGGRTLNGIPGNACSEASQAVVDAFHAYAASGPGGPRFLASNNVAFPAAGLADIGGFDESYPSAAAEDRELCDRWLATGYLLGFEPTAVVRHMREMDLPGLWRQMRGYGAGARAYYEATPRARRPALAGSFHAALAERVRSTRGAGRARLAALVAISQLATARGYYGPRRG